MNIVLFLVLFSLNSVSYGRSDAQVWSSVHKPTSSRASHSIGKYTSGCLRGAATLPVNGQGYQVMRLSRNRNYGHPDLVQFIEKLGQAAQIQGLGTFLVGDMGMARGGPTLSGHRSHQSGLDADIWYLLSRDAEKRTLTASERETWSAPSVLNARETDMNPAQWSPANEQILKAAASAPEVDRIFVNAVVKRELCQSKSNHDWLQKIRPWYAHADHFHVRLKCPAGNFHCEKQEPVPYGDGCGADLAWWFSVEARMPSKKPPAKKIPLPKECNAVLFEE